MKPSVILLLAASAWGQTFRIAGNLVDATTGEPVRRASVALQVLRGASVAKAIAVSDTGGRFEFLGVAGGTYQLTAERRGYPTQVYAPGTGFAVAADLPDLTFRMRPYATLTGTVVDENGDPIAGAAIKLIRSEIQGGRRELRPALSAVTDDRGEYRVASLESGRYYVSADARAQEAGELSFYARRFFPGAASLSGAVPLDLAPGANQRANFQLQPEPAFHVRGQVNGAEALAGLIVSLGPRASGEAFGGTGFPVRFLGEGRFEVSGVTPGQYTISATGTRDGALETALQTIAVGAADLEGVTLTPGPLASISGRVTIEQKEGAAALRADQVHISFLPEEAITKPVVSIQMKEDRTFANANVPAGDYSVRVNVPEPYYLKSAKAGGLDVAASGFTIPAGGVPPPLEVLIGSNGGEVSGTVSIQDKPAGNCFVLLLRSGSRSPSQDRMAVTDAEGKFMVGAVAPGEYMAYAWRNLEEIEYRNPQALTQYSGESVTVAEGAKQALALKLNGN